MYVLTPGESPQVVNGESRTVAKEGAARRTGTSPTSSAPPARNQTAQERRGEVEDQFTTASNAGQCTSAIDPEELKDIATMRERLKSERAQKDAEIEMRLLQQKEEMLTVRRQLLEETRRDALEAQRQAMLAEREEAFSKLEEQMLQEYDEHLEVAVAEAVLAERGLWEERLKAAEERAELAEGQACDSAHEAEAALQQAEAAQAEAEAAKVEAEAAEHEAEVAQQQVDLLAAAKDSADMEGITLDASDKEGPARMQKVEVVERLESELRTVITKAKEEADREKERFNAETKALREENAKLRSQRDALSTNAKEVLKQVGKELSPAAVDTELRSKRIPSKTPPVSTASDSGKAAPTKQKKKKKTDSSSSSSSSDEEAIADIQEASRHARAAGRAVWSRLSAAATVQSAARQAAVKHAEAPGSDASDVRLHRSDSSPLQPTNAALESVTVAKADGDTPSTHTTLADLLEAFDTADEYETGYASKRDLRRKLEALAAAGHDDLEGFITMVSNFDGTIIEQEVYEGMADGCLRSRRHTT